MMHPPIVLELSQTSRHCHDSFPRFSNPPNRLYFHEIGAHTPFSKLSEPLGLVARLPRQVFL